MLSAAFAKRCDRLLNSVFRTRKAFQVFPFNQTVGATGVAIANVSQLASDLVIQRSNP
jgi:hypothetical protein